MNDWIKTEKGIGITWILHGISHGLERCYFWMTTTSDRDLTARLSSDRACGGAICTGCKNHSSGFVKVAAVRVKSGHLQIKMHICTHLHILHMHVYACMIMC